ncbi:hypothetical protein [Sphingopyxis flava]|uniref:Lipoprotein n=1 Tax=Sphingopyxis flava TaxID=1507287 RepID=A0A1T5BBR8_9SPHN|nr:hypothetical protein [Sphingopyxis flava]SKB44507.1 hypothetical protein SAMN06295937_100665 [Sphingopyxis flava]
MDIREFALLTAVSAAAAALGGCTTLSFAPPPVEVDKVISESRPSTCRQLGLEGSRAIDRNVDGALELTNNFLRAYRCAAHEAADGRQMFQVPSFLAAIAAAVGPTFGLDDDGRIAAAASAAVLDRSNAYYAPKEKAQMLDSALDAVLCVKTEAAGISFFDTSTAQPDPAAAETAQAVRQVAESAERASEALGDQLAALRSKSASLLGEMGADPQRAETSAALAEERERVDAMIRDIAGRKGEIDQQAATLRKEAARLAQLAASQVQPSFRIEKSVPGGTVKIDVQRQYFEMVAAALFSVERVLAQRLRDAGSAFDAAGIAAELKALTTAEEAADKAVVAAQNSAVGGGAKAFVSDEAKNAALAELSLDALQPKLQACVVRAKI